MKIVFYWLWQLGWGFVQTLAGFLMFVICSLAGGSHSFYKGAVVTTWKKPASASVGPFLFLSESLKGASCSRVLAHEYGHSIQSLMLGPLYLLVVGLPSFIWCNLPYFQRMRKEKGISYYSVYPENWADRLGKVSSGRFGNIP